MMWEKIDQTRYHIMKTYHKKNIVAAGLVAALVLFAPFYASANTAYNKHLARPNEVASLQSYTLAKASSAIIGLDVKSADGSDLGKVNDVFIDMESGRILSVVISATNEVQLADGSTFRSLSTTLIPTYLLKFDSEGKHLLTEQAEEVSPSSPVHSNLDSGVNAKVHSVQSAAPANTQNPDDSRNTTHQHEIDQMDMRPIGSGVAITRILSMDIENQKGKKVGTINEIYLDVEGGQVIGVVVTTGGFLGMGAHHNVLDLSEIDYNRDENTLRVSLDRKQLRLAPAYTKNNPSWHAASRKRSLRNDK